MRGIGTLLLFGAWAGFQRTVAYKTSSVSRNETRLEKKQKASRKTRNKASAASRRKNRKG